MELHDVDAIVKVSAEAVLADFLLEVARRCGHDANVHRARGVVSDAPDLAFLENAQELDLERERQLADLVEEDRAAVGFLEQAAPLLHRSRERAARVAKELTLEQGVGNCGTVDGYERALGARARRMYETRDELLAGAALAGDENGGRMLCDLAGDGDDFAQSGAAADDTVGAAQRGQLLAEPFDLPAQPLALDRLAYDEEQLIGAERLRDVVVRPATHRLERRFVVAVGAHDDHEATAGRGPVPLEKEQAVHLRHPDVADHDRRVFTRESGQCRLAVARRLDFMTLFAQDQRERLAKARFVVDDEDSHAGLASDRSPMLRRIVSRASNVGNRRWNAAPPSRAR